MTVLARAAGLAGLLALAASASAAQPPPSSAVANAAAREISLPTGIGGCVMHAMDPKVRGVVLARFASGARGIPPELPPAVAKVSAGCTGRPYAASDTGLVAAVLGAFQRSGGAVYFAAYLGIGQHRLDAAWREASAEEKAPFLHAAQNFLDPKAPPIGPTPAETEPFARRLQIETAGDPAKLSPIQLYYMATAFNEAGEAKLAAEGAKPQRP